MEAMMSDPTFWVAVSFVIFMVFIGRKIGAAVAGMLDEHSAKIAKQITEAKALCDESESILHDYQRKQREAEGEAKAMIAQANEDAQILKTAAEADIEAMIARRTKVATDKIHQAEATAVKEVRAAAVDVAIQAATEVLGTSMQGKAGKAMTEKAIADVGAKLH